MKYIHRKFISKQSANYKWSDIFNSVGQRIDTTVFESPPRLDLIDRNGKIINSEDAEHPEQCLAHTFIHSDATVLELGARYGSVSCVINKKLNNKMNQVSVEPDSTVWDALQRNITVNGCEIRLYKGFISKSPLSLIGDDYGMTAITNNDSTDAHISINELQAIYGLKFDTLVADCEGFLGRFLDENPEIYTNFHTVIFEADCDYKCDYTRIRNNLMKHGFKQAIYGFQNVYKK
jgi:FkbM family methyltransferase